MLYHGQVFRCERALSGAKLAGVIGVPGPTSACCASRLDRELKERLKRDLLYIAEGGFKKLGEVAYTPSMCGRGGGIGRRRVCRDGAC